MAEQQAHYTVLARRFRPQTFDDVVGQEHVAQALRNAIRSGRVAHAYLFTGARGVGKTSMARILAKSLNCPDAKDAVPCNMCEICRGIAGGSDVDVLEIDGASNRGIDDIRTLRANVTVKSMRTKYKIYIIDEVHMLTKEAFNALLKTLEEPPPNVKFVFCTTEPNKVPDTILSRCQRFDFGTIATSSIVDRLAQIAQTEQVAVETDALELVARRAAGSMRDSQSLFDQLLAFGGDRITADDVHQLFGTATDLRLIELISAMISRRCDIVLRQLDGALAEGVQLGELANQLVHCVRDLMVVASGGGDLELLGVSNAHRSELAAQAQEWGLQSILAALQILATTQSRLQRASCGRALLELALVQIASLENIDDLTALIDQFRAGSSAAGEKRRVARSVSPEGSGDDPGNRSKPLSLPTKPSPTVASEPKPQKKSDAPGDSVTEPPKEAAASHKFVSGQEREFWAQVISEIDDLLKSHLDCVSQVAISAPDKLEVCFPRSYHFNKQYCERPDIRRRLEVVVSGIAGRSVQLHLSVSKDSESSSSTTALLDAAARQKAPKEVCDPFVQKAMTLFKANVAKADQLPALQTDEGVLD